MIRVASSWRSSQWHKKMRTGFRTNYVIGRLRCNFVEIQRKGSSIMTFRRWRLELSWVLHDELGR